MKSVVYMSLGDFCKPCECSGNIIPGEPGSCDTVTGDCLRCQNNTYGVACALCAPGFFGDAIQAKDCQGNQLPHFLLPQFIYSVCLCAFQLVSATKWARTAATATTERASASRTSSGRSASGASWSTTASRADRAVRLVSADWRR